MLANRSPFAAGSLLVLSLFLATPCLAQSATSAPGPAVETTYPASQLAAAKELIIASGAVRTFDNLLPSVIGRLRQTFTQQRPDLVKDLEASLTAIQPEVEAKREEILDIAAKVYASKMSEQELKDSVAFFKSPTGQKYVQTQPEIFDELFSQVQNWMAQVSDFAMSRLRTEMKKRGHDL